MLYDIESNKFTYSQSLTILERVAEADKKAICECVDLYENLIWALAKKYTNSNTEAEDAVLEIFRNIWLYSRHFDSQKLSEQNFIITVSRYTLIKSSKTSLFNN